ncbi:MAG TPA: hypothetical protein VN887_13270 [Candidatus Angelobacter sp.]|nr:hypothetical protein [Candidatus Angelobacter sp.]
MNEIKFACPHCQQHIACDEGYCGHQIACPACAGGMIVPGHTAFGFGATSSVSLAVPVATRVSRQAGRSTSNDPDVWTEKEWDRHVAESERHGFSGLQPPWGKTRDWLVFWVVLVAPTIAAIFLWMGVDTNMGAENMLAGNPDAGTRRVLVVSVILSIAAGFFCGFWLARRYSQDAGTRVMVGLLLSVKIAFFSFICCFFGCVVAPLLYLR